MARQLAVMRLQRAGDYLADHMRAKITPGESAPGGPPAEQSGALRNSIGVSRVRHSGSHMWVEVGSFGLSYAAMLEEGTERMDARPFIQQTFQEQRSEIIRILRHDEKAEKHALLKAFLTGVLLSLALRKPAARVTRKPITAPIVKRAPAFEVPSVVEEPIGERGEEWAAATAAKMRSRIGSKASLFARSRAIERTGFRRDIGQQWRQSLLKTRVRQTATRVRLRERIRRLRQQEQQAGLWRFRLSQLGEQAQIERAVTTGWLSRLTAQAGGRSFSQASTRIFEQFQRRAKGRRRGITEQVQEIISRVQEKTKGKQRPQFVPGIWQTGASAEQIVQIRRLIREKIKEATIH